MYPMGGVPGPPGPPGPVAEVVTVQGVDEAGATVPLAASPAGALVTRPQPATYKHLAASGTTVVKPGAGRLRRLVVNSTGTVTLRDGTNVIAVVKVGGTLDYDILFETNLTVVIVGNADVTVCFD